MKNAPTTINGWVTRELVCAEINRHMRNAVIELRAMGATAAADAIARARKSVQGAQRHACGMGDRLRARQLCNIEKLRARTAPSFTRDARGKATGIDPRWLAPRAKS